MNTPACTVAEITSELFVRLQRNHLRYAILRNYERLALSAAIPADHPLTDIDLVVHRDDVPAWRNLAAGVAEDCGWDVLTECSHFHESRVAEHTIEIFRFFRLSPPACLQVDIFHGYLLLGLPFKNELAMLEDRFEDPQLRLTRVSPSTENAFRMLQIHSLLPHGATPEKIARYRAKVIEHYTANETQFRLRLRTEFSAFGVRALDALVGDDWAAFRRAMESSKTWFLGRFWLEHPFLAPRYLYERTRDHWLRFIRRQCGFVLPAYAPSEKDRLLLRLAFDRLKQEKILPGWTDRHGARPRVSWQERKVMERGGIAVKWANAPEHALDVTQAVACEELVTSILRAFIARHPALYVRGREVSHIFIQNNSELGQSLTEPASAPGQPRA